MIDSDFNQLLTVLNRKKPSRPVLFEFFLNASLYTRLASSNFEEKDEDYFRNNPINPIVVSAFHNAGYDYVTTTGSTIRFEAGKQDHQKSVSMNQGFVITDKNSFDKYQWPDPDKIDYSGLQKGARFLPDGMKFIVNGPGGILENVIQLVGFENLCIMLSDNRKLVGSIFASIGERFVRHYEIACKYDTVGACISNDDWGFKTQTLLSLRDMREYVIPWHKKIADAVHQTNRPVILHSCGMVEEVMNDIIDVIGYDGKHSYEDTICPVEQMYDKYSDRIAILGGIDLNYVCQSTPQQVYNRSKAMLEKAAMQRGAYALGTGNSVPEYTPNENYFAMINAARDLRGLERLKEKNVMVKY